MQLSAGKHFEMPRFELLLALALTFCLQSVLLANQELRSDFQWRYQAPRGACEIACFSSETGLMYVTVYGGVDVVDARTGTCVGSLSAEAGYYPTSVAYSQGRLAIAWAAHDRRLAGKIELFELNNSNGITPSDSISFSAGYLPDMVTFSPDGRFLLAANEGEPTEDFAFDPEGTITIIDTQAGSIRTSVRQVTFNQFDSQREELRTRGIRIFGPSSRHADRQATVSEDLEPEFIAISSDSKRAWVALQENNAIAEIDIPAGHVSMIHSLGMKQFLHAEVPNLDNNKTLWTAGLDASDTDGGSRIRHWPVVGLYQPDGIASLRSQGSDYLLTVNEGDPRKYVGFDERCPAGELTGRGIALDEHLRARLLLADDQLGRLEVSMASGDTNGDGDLDELCCFGARSFTLWKMDQARKPEMVFDSGNDFEWITSQKAAQRYNADSTAEGIPDQCSPQRGPEPEGVAVGKVGSSLIAAISLEKTGGVMLYDVTVPAESTFLEYLPPLAEDGLLDCAPEGIVMIPAAESPSNDPMLVVCNEGSGTMTAYTLGWSRDQ